MGWLQKFGLPSISKFKKFDTFDSTKIASGYFQVMQILQFYDVRHKSARIGSIKRAAQVRLNYIYLKFINNVLTFPTDSRFAEKILGSQD